MILSSLSLTQSNSKETLLPLNIISNSINFVWEGSVDIYYKESPFKLLTLRPGSYYGEISFIFQTKNQFYYQAIPVKNQSNIQLDEPAKIYQINGKYMNQIFKMYPLFKKVL